MFSHRWGFICSSGLLFNEVVLSWQQLSKSQTVQRRAPLSCSLIGDNEKTPRWFESSDCVEALWAWIHSWKPFHPASNTRYVFFSHPHPPLLYMTSSLCPNAVCAVLLLLVSLLSVLSHPQPPQLLITSTLSRLLLALHQLSALIPLRSAHLSLLRRRLNSLPRSHEGELVENEGFSILDVR